MFSIFQALACDSDPPQTVQFGQITYADYPDGVSIYDYPDSASGVFSIPEQIDGKPVLGISGVRFYGEDPRSCFHPEGQGAFDHCSGLTGVIIPSSVTTIGAEAFLGCLELTTVLIPEYVSSIGDSVLADCHSLETIEVGPRNASYVSIDGVLFTSDLTKLVQYPGAKSGDYVIPQSVTTIGIGAFQGCRNLTSITIPEGVETIQRNTFAGCQNLSAVTLPESLTWIAQSAFADCAMLKEIIIPEAVTDIGSFAFFNCTELANVSIPRSVQYIGLEWPGDWQGRFQNRFLDLHSLGVPH